MREHIHVETKTTMAFTQLGSGIFLQMCREVYGIAENVASIIMKEFFLAIRKHLKPLMIPKLTKDKIKEIIVGFESLHGIPYSLGAIDGSRIPIVAPKVEPKSYYY
jgi:hypothetical protein